MSTEIYRGFILRSHPIINKRGLEYGVVCARCPEGNESTYYLLAQRLRRNTDCIVNQGRCEVDGEDVSGVVYTMIFDEQDRKYTKERETRAFDLLKQSIDSLWMMR